MFKNNGCFSKFSSHVGSLQSKANPEKLRAVLDSDKEIEPPNKKPYTEIYRLCFDYPYEKKKSNNYPNDDKKNLIKQFNKCRDGNYWRINKKMST